MEFCHFSAINLGPGILRLAETSIERFSAHATRLYEQGQKERSKAPLLGKYVRRWRGWAKSGLTSIDPSWSTSLSRSISAATSLVPSRAALAE